jgi:hypothetical protein
MSAVYLRTVELLSKQYELRAEMMRIDDELARLRDSAPDEWMRAMDENFRRTSAELDEALVRKGLRW